MDSGEKAQAIRGRASRRIADLIPGAARQILDEQAELKKRLNHGNKIIVRLVTGGYWSQSLDYHVMRKLGEKMMADKKDAAR